MSALRRQLALLAVLAAAGTTIVGCTSSKPPSESPRGRLESQSQRAPEERPAARLVSTPGGYRDARLVHRIGSEHGLAIKGRELREFDLATKKTFDFLSAPEVGALGLKTVAKPAAEGVAALGSGWITYAYWLNGTTTPVASFSTRWTVPPAPRTRSGQLVYLFEGIQSVGPNSAILQPVLQWGTSAAGGGEFWSIASWYVVGEQAFCTEAIPVNVGETLIGWIALTNTWADGQHFDYACQFEGHPRTAFHASGVSQLQWCNETLEAYGITQASDYPEAPMTAMEVLGLRSAEAPLAHAWTAETDVSDCGQHTAIDATPGKESVELHYR